MNYDDSEQRKDGADVDDNTHASSSSIKEKKKEKKKSQTIPSSVVELNGSIKVVVLPG